MGSGSALFASGGADWLSIDAHFLARAKARANDKKGTRLTKRDMQQLVDLLPAPLLPERRNRKIHHAEVILYKENWHGHWHKDPDKDGDDIVLMTLYGQATFSVSKAEHSDPIESVVTTAGTAIPAGKPCLDVPLRQKLTDLDPDPCVGHRCDTDPCP